MAGIRLGSPMGGRSLQTAGVRPPTLGAGLGVPAAGAVPGIPGMGGMGGRPMPLSLGAGALGRPRTTPVAIAGGSALKMPPGARLGAPTLKGLARSALLKQMKG